MPQAHHDLVVLDPHANFLLPVKAATTKNAAAAGSDRRQSLAAGH
jgi:hypothetical protein